MAQAPKPMGVMNKSDLPRRFVFKSELPIDFAFVFSVLIGSNRGFIVIRCCRFNSPPAEAIEATAVCRAIDFR
jgi:hypothetical protein